MGPFKCHPNLSDAVNRAIAQSEIDGGVWLKNCADGTVLKVKTRNTLYTVVVVDGKKRLVTIQGSDKYCPTPVEAMIAGSTWGGSMLKVGFIGRGMHMEFVISQNDKGSGAQSKSITTSQIEEVWEREKGD